MAHTPIEAQRSTLLHVAPEELTLVTDKSHNLYDPRVELPYDENFVLNIMTYGVLEPVLVHRNGDEIEVVAGRGRVKAAIEANIRLKKEGKKPILVPIIPRGGNDVDLYGVLISENEVRGEDSAVNKGLKMRKLKDMGYTNSQIAVAFGITRQHVENMLAIDNLAKEVKDAIEADEITATAALELKNLSRSDQITAINTLQESGGKPTASSVKEFVETRAFETSADTIDYSSRFATVKYKAQPKKRLEKRLSMFQESGFQSDRYLQSKPADFQEGFAYALKWALGHEQEDVPFDETEELEKTTINEE